MFTVTCPEKHPIGDKSQWQIQEVSDGGISQVDAYILASELSDHMFRYHPGKRIVFNTLSENIDYEIIGDRRTMVTIKPR